MRDKLKFGCSYGVIKDNGTPLYNGERKIGNDNTGWKQTRRIPVIFNGDFEAKIDVVGGGYKYENRGTNWDYSPFYIEDNMIYLTNIQGNLRHLPPRQLMTSMVLANCLYKNKPDTTYADKSATYNFNKWQEYDFTLDMKGRPLIQMLVKPTPMVRANGEVYGYDIDGHYVFYKDLGNIIVGEKRGLKEKDVFYTQGELNIRVTNTLCKFENGIEIFTYTDRTLNNHTIYTSIVNFPDEKTLLENPLYFYEPTFFTMGGYRSRGRTGVPNGDEIVICINEIPLVRIGFFYHYQISDEPNSHWASGNWGSVCDAHTKLFTQKDKLLLFIASYFGVFNSAKNAIIEAKNNYTYAPPYNPLDDGLKSDRTDDISSSDNTDTSTGYDGHASNISGDSVDVGWDIITIIDIVGVSHTLIDSTDDSATYKFNFYIKDTAKLTDSQISRLEQAFIEYHPYSDGETHTFAKSAGYDKQITNIKTKMLEGFAKFYLGDRPSGAIPYNAGIIFTDGDGFSSIDTSSAKIIKVKTEIIERFKLDENDDSEICAIKVTVTPKQNIDTIAWFGKVKNLGAFKQDIFYNMPNNTDGGYDGVFEVVADNAIIVYYRKGGVKFGEKLVALNSKDNAEIEYAYEVDDNKIIDGDILVAFAKGLEVRSVETSNYIFTQDNPMRIYVNGATLITRSYPQPQERIDW